MQYYFAQFWRDPNDGSYAVDFPEIDGCYTCGADLEEAMRNAEECLACSLDTAVKLGEVIPAPGDLAHVKKLAEKKAAEEGCPLDGEEFYQAFPAKTPTEKPVQIAISLPPSALKIIDAAAKRHGFTRSGFLSSSALKYAREMG